MTRYFVILADMRTGSNHLEDELARYSGVSTYGELFNPHFLGGPKNDQVLGFDVRARNANPIALLEKLIETDDGLPGFRLFRDHDPRVLAHCLEDPACAKIILTRNPVDSFISLQIARQTGQWWMGDVRKSKTAKIRFDTQAYTAYLESVLRHRSDLRRQLQVSGQTAFFIDYSEINDDKIISGLAAFLGIEPGARSARKRHGRPQNPTAIRDKVTNPSQVDSAARARFQIDPDASPEFEPSPPPMVKGFVACGSRPVVHLALTSHTATVTNEWLTNLDRDRGGTPVTGLNQRDLRKWLRTHENHLSFVVVEHPLLRAFHAYREAVQDDATANPDLRATLINDFGHPDVIADPSSEGLRAFLRFLEPNLKRQTSVGIDRIWSTQTAQIQGLSTVIVPKRIVTLPELSEVLEAPAPETLPSKAELGAIFSKDFNDLVRRAYRRDFLMFGFSDFEVG